MANEEHLKILNQGVEQWNEWRLENATLRIAIRPDLGAADLSFADLSGAYLFEADLNSANLGGADLSKAKLRGASLAFVYLGGCEPNQC